MEALWNKQIKTFEMSSRLSKSSHRLSTSQSKGFRVLVKNRVNHEKVLSSRQATETYVRLEESRDIDCHADRLQSQNYDGQSSRIQETEPMPAKDLGQYIKNLKNPDHQGMEDSLTQRSRSSVCSRYSTRSETKSEMAGTSLAFRIGLTNGIQDLEQKLEGIIRNKLYKAAKTNPFPYSQKPANQLDQQLSQLTKKVKQLKVLRGCDEDPSQINQDLNNLGRKINMLEKIIAESTTESELMKKFYHHQRIHRNPSLVNKNNFTLYKSASILQKLSSSCMSDTANYTKKHIGYQTTANYSYQKPAGGDYQIFKHKNVTFRMNRQPVPRSTYSCEYLTYGTMPRYRFKEDTSIVKMGRSGAGLGSTYTSDFKDIKNAKGAKIDYKELDCYQDKFKNIKISFMQSCQKSSHQSQLLIKKHKANKDRENELAMNPHSKFPTESKAATQGRDSSSVDKTKDRLKQSFSRVGSNQNHSETMNKFMKTTLMSQTKKEFISKSHGVASIIKDRNLNSLKNSYKTMLRA